MDHVIEHDDILVDHVNLDHIWRHVFSIVEHVDCLVDHVDLEYVLGNVEHVVKNVDHVGERVDCIVNWIILDRGSSCGTCETSRSG